MLKKVLDCNYFNALGKNEASLLLVEPQPIITYAIKHLLKSNNISINIYEIDNGLKVLNAFRQYKPTLVILSSSLPGLSLEDVINQLFQRDKNIKVIIYADSQEISSLQKLLNFGVRGLVLKTQPVQKLLDAMLKVLSNKGYMDESLQPGKLLNSSLSESRDLTLPHLSPRERQILKLVAEGLKNREISSSFSISIKTVETHRLNLMRKLDAHHVVDLVRWAKRYHLVNN